MTSEYLFGINNNFTRFWDYVGRKWREGHHSFI